MEARIFCPYTSRQCMKPEMLESAVELVVESALESAVELVVELVILPACTTQTWQSIAPSCYVPEALFCSIAKQCCCRCWRLHLLPNRKHLYKPALPRILPWRHLMSRTTLHQGRQLCRMEARSFCPYTSRQCMKPE